MLLSVSLLIVVALISILGWIPNKSKQNKIIFIILVSTAFLLNCLITLSSYQYRKSIITYGRLNSNKLKNYNLTDSIVTFAFGTDFKNNKGASLFTKSGNPIISGGPFKGFKIFISEDNRIAVSFTLRDANGDVIAILQNNEWKVNSPQKAMDRNYTKDMLEIIDYKNQPVLQLKVSGTQVTMNGVFYDETGNGLALFPNNNNDFGLNSALFIKINKTTPVSNCLKPLFNPSSTIIFENGDSVQI